MCGRYRQSPAIASSSVCREHRSNRQWLAGRQAQHNWQRKGDVAGAGDQRHLPYHVTTNIMPDSHHHIPFLSHTRLNVPPWRRH